MNRSMESRPCTDRARMGLMFPPLRVLQRKVPYVDVFCGGAWRGGLALCISERWGQVWLVIHEASIITSGESPHYVEHRFG